MQNSSKKAIDSWYCCVMVRLAAQSNFVLDRYQLNAPFLIIIISTSFLQFFLVYVSRKSFISQVSCWTQIQKHRIFLCNWFPIMVFLPSYQVDHVFRLDLRLDFLRWEFEVEISTIRRLLERSFQSAYKSIYVGLKPVLHSVVGTQVSLNFIKWIIIIVELSLLIFPCLMGNSMKRWKSLFFLWRKLARPFAILSGPYVYY